MSSSPRSFLRQFLETSLMLGMGMPKAACRGCMRPGLVRRKRDPHEDEGQHMKREGLRRGIVIVPQ